MSPASLLPPSVPWFQAHLWRQMRRTRKNKTERQTCLLAWEKDLIAYLLPVYPHKKTLYLRTLFCVMLTPPQKLENTLAVGKKYHPNLESTSSSSYINLYPGSVEKRASCELIIRHTEFCESHWAVKRTYLGAWPSWELSWERGTGKCRSPFRGGQAWAKRDKRAHDPSCKHKDFLGFQRTHELSQC